MKMCPLIGDPCMEHGCTFYRSVLGKNPNTGEDINHFDCSIALIPLLLIENSKQQHQTGAAVESFRNEMIKGNEATVAVTNELTQAVHGHRRAIVDERPGNGNTLTN